MSTILWYIWQAVNFIAIGNALYQLIRLFTRHAMGTNEWWEAAHRVEEWTAAGLIKPKYKDSWKEIDHITRSFRKKTTVRRLQLLGGPNGLFYYQVLSARKRPWRWNNK